MLKLGERVLVDSTGPFASQTSSDKVLRGTITELLTLDSNGEPLQVRVEYDEAVTGHRGSMPAWAVSFSFKDTNPSDSQSVSHSTFRISSEVFSAWRLTRDLEWYRQEKIDQIL